LHNLQYIEGLILRVHFQYEVRPQQLCQDILFKSHSFRIFHNSNKENRYDVYPSLGKLIK